MRFYNMHSLCAFLSLFVRQFFSFLSNVFIPLKLCLHKSYGIGAVLVIKISNLLNHGVCTVEELTIVEMPSEEEIVEDLGSDSPIGSLACKAGNKKCRSLVEASNFPSEAMACDVCCSEPGFCRDCCCILCCKTTNSAYGGFSFIRCEAMISNGIICGHMAHIECALRSYMAGTVGGSIGLDAEYYCRRCDKRTELVSHVTKLFRSCESIDSRDAVEKILSVGACVLRGSQKTSAKGLLRRIEFAMSKVWLNGWSRTSLVLNMFICVIFGL